MLRDEMAPKIQNASLRMKINESLEIQRKIDEFRKSGGKVKVFGIGEIAESVVKTPHGKTMSDYFEKGAKANSLRISNSRLKHDSLRNITVRRNIAKTPAGKYLLSIANQHVGTFDSLEAALAARQRKRKANKMVFYPEDK